MTTEVPLPSSSRPDYPLPHPPMLFHSHLEDEFPRPGWVKDHKENKVRTREKIGQLLFPFRRKLSLK